MIQIKTTDIAKYRKMHSIKQQYKCAICGTSLASGVVALDHSHVTGHIRSTLCMPCNRVEGGIVYAIKFKNRNTHLAKTDAISWLRRLADYYEHHEGNPSGVIHPSFDLKKGKQKPKKRTKK